MIKVFAPASIGNVGPGFDALGLAVAGLGDAIEAEKIPNGIELSVENGGTLPSDPLKNTAGVAASETLKLIGNPGGVRLKLIKGLPNGSGLGSSAASAAAAAFAVNALYGEKLSRAELVAPATAAEASVSGGFFADNTAPALLGGAVLIRSKDPLDVAPLGTIETLRIALVTPAIEVLTKNARAVLPKTVPMEGFVANMANAAGIAAAFLKNDYALFARSLRDVVIEPHRAGLIPGFAAARKAAFDAGADGFAISGSGPTVFAVTDDDGKAERIRAAVTAAFAAAGVKSSGRVARPDPAGTKFIY